MSVIIKGQNIMRLHNGTGNYEILEPTSADISNLKEGDRVLMEMKLEKGCFMATPIYTSKKNIVAILEPSPEPQRGLPDEVTISPSSGDDVITLALAVNDILRHLKVKEKI